MHEVSLGSVYLVQRFSDHLIWLQGSPIIYVGLDYRLGPLGFPQGSEAGNRGILNLGLKDQLAALTWVHENIDAFGGDKNKVA